MSKRREELIKTVTESSMYRSTIEKLSEDEKKKTESLILDMIGAFVPAIEMLDQISEDPKLLAEFQKAISEHSTKDEVDQTGKTST